MDSLYGWIDTLPLTRQKKYVKSNSETSQEISVMQ